MIRQPLRLALPLALLAFLVLPVASTQADDGEQAALEAAHEGFADVLQNTNNLFFKQQTNENGVKFYSVIFELGGKTTRMIFSLKVLGTYQGETVIGYTGWSPIVESETPVPPAVIKAIATVNDRLSIGNISTNKDFTSVYSNVTGSANGLTPANMWMNCAYLQDNLNNMKTIVDEAMSGTSR